MAMDFHSFLILLSTFIFFSSRLTTCSCFQLLLKAVVTAVSYLSIDSFTIFGAVDGSPSNFEWSFLKYFFSSFLSPNFIKQRRTALFNLLKSIRIFVLSGFIEIPNPRFNPRVSKTSFDTESLLLHKLWLFRLLDFRGRSIGSVVVSIKCITFCLTEYLASAMHFSFSFSMFFFVVA